MDFLKNKLLTIVLVLCLAFTVFVGITATKKGNTGTVQEIVTSTISPIQKYVYIAGQRISNMFYFVSSIATTRKENIELKSEVDQANQKLVEYDRLKRDNQSLSDMLNFKNSHPDFTTIGANVIAKVGENWFDTLIIDAGEKDGVKKGNYVACGQGLVGVVYEVSATTSKVKTIMDPSSSIPGKVSSTGEDGVIIGISNSSKEKYCKISYLPLETKAQPGDMIITSNIVTDQSSFVKSDIIVGSILKIEDEKPNLSKVAYLKPAVDFSKIEKVMVITK